MYKLHYEKLDLQGDTQFFEFRTHREMIDFIDAKCVGRNGQCVWLIARDGTTDLFVSESHISIQEFLKTKPCWSAIGGDYHLHEYASFEEAYIVALNMIEGKSGLCYE